MNAFSSGVSIFKDTANRTAAEYTNENAAGQKQANGTAEIRGPDTDSTGTQWSRTDASKDTSHLKDQIKEAGKKLNTMKPVASITVKGNMPAIHSEKINWVKANTDNIPEQIERKGLGSVTYGIKKVADGVKYIRTPADLAAFMAVPEVIENGTEIAYHENHKGYAVSSTKDVESWTFPAPVEINGKTGNLGVVVQRTTGLFYKAHRIIMPDGAVFELTNNNEADSGLSQGATVSGRLVGPTESASDGRITQFNENGKGKFSRTDGVDKQHQLEVIRSTNAMRDDIHTGIRSVEDIRTFEEALADEGIGEGDAGMAPDVSAEMIAKAKESGDIQRNLRRRQSGNECLRPDL